MSLMLFLITTKEQFVYLVDDFAKTLATLEFVLYLSEDFTNLVLKSLGLSASVQNFVM